MNKNNPYVSSVPPRSTGCGTGTAIGNIETFFVASLLSCLLLLLLLLMLPGHARAAAPSGPIDPKACTQGCHLDFAKKATVHKPAERGSTCIKCHQLATPNQHAFKPLPAKRSEICFECHDDMAEAKKVKHKPFSAGNCTKCHDPHQSEHKSLLRLPPAKLCVDCHEDMEASEKHTHKPFKAGNCVKCHDPHQSDHDKQLRKAPEKLCFECHDAEEFQGKTVHGPVAAGKCLDCHHPHQSNNAKQLRKAPPQLCLDCHDRELKDASGSALPATKSLFTNKEVLAHPPFAEGKCTDCHKPHVTDTRRLLAKNYAADFYAPFKPETYALCFSCHEQKAFLAPRTLSDTRFRNGNLNLHYRHVNRDKGRSCGACHTPHGTLQEKLIHPSFAFGKRRLSLKFEKTETGGSCDSVCHGTLKYDRCKPETITLRTTPRQGEDASDETLQGACDAQRQKPKKAAVEGKDSKDGKAAGAATAKDEDKGKAKP